MTGHESDPLNPNGLSLLGTLLLRYQWASISSADVGETDGLPQLAQFLDQDGYLPITTHPH